MGWIKKLVVGRWFTRWLLRGGPWSVAAKLAGVAIWSAWKWRRENRRAERQRQAREIPAEYEVVEERRGELASDGRAAGTEGQGRNPGMPGG